MEHNVDEGLLEAIEALTPEQVVALQAESGDVAEHLRQMVSCVERFTRAESAKFVLAA